MKSQMKMIIASVVVIALALTAVSGVTYSWFSDSESSNITVTSGTVDLDSRLYEGTPSTEPATSILGDPLSISFEGANSLKQYTYYITNNSTIDIKWRIYVEFTEVAPGNQLVQDMKVNGQSLSVLVSTPTTYVSSMEFTDWATPDPAATVEDKTITGTINFYLPEDSTASGQTLTGKIIIEAYQKSATIDIPSTTVVPITGGITSEIPSTDSGALVDATDEIGIKLEFDSSTSAVISNTTLEVQKDVTPTGSFILNDGETPVASYDISLSSGVSNLDGTVKISITVDGVFTDPVVYYYVDEDNKTAMPVIDTRVDGGKTVVTFITNHFSTYVVGQKAPTGNVIGQLGSMQKTFETFDEAMEAGCDMIILLNNAQYDLNKYIENNVTIDLNSHTLTTRGIDANYGAIVNIKDGSLNVTNGMWIDHGSAVTMENVILNSERYGFFVSDAYENNHKQDEYKDAGGNPYIDTLKLYNVTMNVDDFYCIGAYTNSRIIIESGSYTSGSGAIITTNGTKGCGGQDWTIKNASFNVCENDEIYAIEMAAKDAGEGYNPISVGIQCHNDGTFLIDGCTFNVENGIGVSVRGGDATINGCTFSHT